MKKYLYRKVLKKLLRFFKRILGKKLKGHQKSRVQSLAAYITGMLRTKCSHLSAIGKGLLQLIKGYSREKAAKKFLYNAHINYDTYYLPYIQDLLKFIVPILNKGKGIYLVIDGSQMGKHHAALMVSIVFGRRGLPIRWFVKAGSKGHFSTKNHTDLITEVHQDLEGLIAPDLPITLLGDGEFDSPELQVFCKAKNWNYVFRTACNTVLYEDGDKFKPKNILLSQHQDYFFIRGVEFTEKRLENINFLLWHDKKYDKPLPLVSNFDEPEDIINAYDKRYSIECLFKDLKSTSFNLDKTRLRDVAAISNLIMIAVFAFTLTIKLALMYQHPLIRSYMHRIRPDRTVNSFYTFALALLDFFLEHGIDFDFDERLPIGITKFDVLFE
ncbi:MAG: transposase [Saprospiraceae bacterium]